MSTSEVLGQREDDREYPVKELSFTQDDLPRPRSLSSSLKSNASRSIYDALRASSSTEDETATSRAPSSSANLEPVDNRLAANVAQFYSAADSSPGRTRGGSAPDGLKYNPNGVGRPPRAHLMADKLRIASTGEVTAWSLPDKLTDFIQEDQESSIADSSFKATYGSSASPEQGWPQNVKSPVSPTLPEFPPPVRSPTPPGLPSFGTEEARSYDFRIGARPPDPSRSESLLRRLFQRATSPNQGSQQQPPRVYAEDGTAVLGSFPQRQSGHGTNSLKGADDHPFQQRNLPVAQYDGTNDVAPSPGSIPQFIGRSIDTEEEHAAADATLEWLAQNMSPRVSPPQPLSDSTLLGPEGSGRGPDSYQTCVSQVREPHPQGRVARPGHSTLADPCFLAPTQSAGPITTHDGVGTGKDDAKQHSVFWKQAIGRATSMLCCCRRVEEDTEALNPNTINTTTTATTTNTTTQDTYVTARDQASNEPHHPRPVLPTGSHPVP
ncbi:hypothetical protein BJX70DRAFT_263555 [Aspergillus crustosus]